MFKVLLIVYVLGGGGSDTVKNTYNTNFVFQEFYSMEDCNIAEQGMKDLLTWNRTGDKEGAKKDPISVLYSTKCVEMTTSGPMTTTPIIVPEMISPPLPDAIIEHRRHKRWDDL